MTNEQDAFIKLVQIVADLRDPETGCPWDIEQTHVSLGKYLREESDEVLVVLKTFEPGKDGSSDGEYEALCEELGDVLLQVLLHSQLALESGKFSIYEVINGLNDKLVRRHPHVFGDSDATSIEEVTKQWEQIKGEEQKLKAKQEELK